MTPAPTIDGSKINWKGLIATLLALFLLLLVCGRGCPDSTTSQSSNPSADAVTQRCTELAAAGYANCVTDQLGKGVPQDQVDTVCSGIARAFRDQCIRNGGN